MLGYVCTALYGYVSLWLTTLAIVGTGTSWPVREQDLAHRPKDTGNVGNRYRAAKDLVILPFLVVIVVVKTGSKKNSNNLCHNRRCSVKPKDQTSHALFRPPVLCIARRSICRDLTLGPTMTHLYSCENSAQLQNPRIGSQEISHEKEPVVPATH